MPLTVLCLCAQWCGVCRDFQSLFRALAPQHPEHFFVWLDVENVALWHDEVHVETFPTLLLFNAEDAPVFFGPVLPHKATVKRLLEKAVEPGFGEPWPVALQPFLDRFLKTDWRVQSSLNQNYLELE